MRNSVYGWFTNGDFAKVSSSEGVCDLFAQFPDSVLHQTRYPASDTRGNCQIPVSVRVCSASLHARLFSMPIQFHTTSLLAENASLSILPGNCVAVQSSAVPVHVHLRTLSFVDSASSRPNPKSSELKTLSAADGSFVSTVICSLQCLSYVSGILNDDGLGDSTLRFCGTHFVARFQWRPYTKLPVRRGSSRAATANREISDTIMCERSSVCALVDGPGHSNDLEENVL